MPDGALISKAVAYAAVRSPYRIDVAKAVVYAVVRPGIVHYPPVPGGGVWLLRGDGGNPERFHRIPGVKDIDGPDETVDLLECSHLLSERREFIAGLHDWGTLQADIFVVPNDPTHQGLYFDFFNGITRNFRIVVPEGDPLHQPVYLELSGFVSQYERYFTLNQAEMLRLTLKLTTPRIGRRGVFIAKTLAFAVVQEVA